MSQRESRRVSSSSAVRCVLIGQTTPIFSCRNRENVSTCPASSMVGVAVDNCASRSGTTSTILAAHTIAPCSPCRNCENCQAWECRRISARRDSSAASHIGLPNSGWNSSGSPIGFFGSMSCAQSMRDWASHCLSFPFWYRERRRARPSSYSHVKRASPALGTSHEYGVGTSVYLSLVVMSRRLSARYDQWSYDEYHNALHAAARQA